MVENVLLVVDGSVPPDDAAMQAHGLLPWKVGIVILQVVSQLPYAWTAWPAFPSAADDLARAWAYVSEVTQGLKARGRPVSARVHFSPLGAAQMDREVLRLAEAIRPDLICLALEKGWVRAGIVRDSVMPVLVAKPHGASQEAEGRWRPKPLELEPPQMNPLLLNPAGAMVFRQAGIL